MRRETVLELGHSAHSADRVDGENHDRTHLDEELHEISPQYRPHSRTSRIGNGDYETDPDGDHFPGDVESEKVDVAQTERDRENLDHRLGDPAENYEVDRYGEVKRAESAQRGGRPSTVADFGE